MRPIEGMSLEDICKKKEETKEFRKAVRDEQKREIKERKRKQMEQKKKDKKSKNFEKSRNRATNVRQFNKARR